MKNHYIVILLLVGLLFSGSCWAQEFDDRQKYWDGQKWQPLYSPPLPYPTGTEPEFRPPPKPEQKTTLPALGSIPMPPIREVTLDTAVDWLQDRIERLEKIAGVYGQPLNDKGCHWEIFWTRHNIPNNQYLLKEAPFLSEWEPFCVTHYQDGTLWTYYRRRVCEEEK